MELKEFLDKYNTVIAAAIEKNLTPLYNPLRPDGVEDFGKKIPLLRREPFPVQSEVIKGLSKAIYKDGRQHLFLCGEMGSGKSFISLAVVAMSPAPMRTLVVCPTHLVEKWGRETRLSLGDSARLADLSADNAIEILDGLRSIKTPPQSHEIYVIGKERAKLSYGWRPAAVKTKRSKLPHCPGCGKACMDGDDRYMTFSAIARKRLRCSVCGEALWQAENKLRRFAPAEFIKKYLKGFFDLVILDEIQDYKSGDSLQGRAMGYLLSASKRCICLTGTLNGGYADDLFHLLFRMSPAMLKADGFKHGGSNKWLETYGVIERVKKIEDNENYYGRGRRKNEIIRKRPGVSPLVVGKYLLDKSCFIRLADIIDGLPPYEENVLTIKKDPLFGREYEDLEKQLSAAVKSYGTRALGAMLQALLSYPDSCVLFPEHIKIKDKYGEVCGEITAPQIEADNGGLLNKEKELIELIRQEKQQGRKALVYLTFTNTRDIRPRLRRIIEDAGFSAATLDASVAPKRREAWIEKHTKAADILLVNAELVKTGLDLYDFPTVVFYQVGYNIFTLRQAARRSWRIGQSQPVKVYFFCYGNTMQETAISLIAKKLEIALMVEGDLPEGLAEHASGGESLIEEMGKALVEGGNYRGAEAAWACFRKKEIEALLDISGKETIFSEGRRATVKKPENMLTKTTIDKNVVVRVAIIEGRKKKQSTVEVKYGDLESVAGDRAVQFAMF